jgi:hypothetical protein
MDDKAKAQRAGIGSLFVFFLNVGLQVSGYQNIVSAVASLSVAGILGLYWLKLRTTYSTREKTLVGLTLVIVGCAIGIFGMLMIASGERMMAIGFTSVITGCVIGIFGMSMIASGEKPNRDEAFALGQAIYYESRSVRAPDKRDTRFFETKFYIVVCDRMEDGKTLRNVQAEIYGYDTPVVAAIRDFNFNKIDLKHSQIAYFLLGKTVGSDFLGNFVGVVNYDRDLLKRYEHNIVSGFKPTFEVWSYENIYRFGLNDPPLEGWKLGILISADDKKSRRVILDVNPSKRIPIRYERTEASTF